MHKKNIFAIIFKQFLWPWAIGHRPLTGSAGMAMIEIIILLAVLATALAVTGRDFLTKKLRTDTRRVTEQKLAVLKTALLRFYADYDEFPNAITDLETNPGYTVWYGPYIRDDFENNDYQQDGWRQNFVYNYAGGAWGSDPCALYSRGVNNVDNGGTGDDIVVNPDTGTPTQIDPASVMMEKVRRVQKELAVVNAAANKFMTDNGSYPNNVNQLRGQSYIAIGYETDEWNNDYIAGAAPDEFYSAGPDGNDITQTAP